MRVNNQSYRTVWMDNLANVYMIDQNWLPFAFKVVKAKTHLDVCSAIKKMTVRGAGAIGAAAGFAMAQSFLEAPADKFWSYAEEAKKHIQQTRPTAQNLFYAVNTVFDAAKNSRYAIAAAVQKAQQLADEDVESCRKIGEYGNSLIKNKNNIETHCNAGWLAFVDYGTALSPIYKASKSGKAVFVYVDETRPRNQGAKLTAWELYNEGIPHMIIPDSAGACLMANGKVDMVIVGADRIAGNGDVANKIGTLERAIVAREFGIPFYVAAPTSTFDLKCATGAAIPIEYRDPNEVLYQKGIGAGGKLEEILVCSPDSSAFNPAFDVTPAKYITAIITEKGIIKPEEVLNLLFTK